MNSLKYLVSLFIICSLAGCKDDTTENPVDNQSNNDIEVQVDLQYGFAGKNVTIKLNSENIFNVTLSGMASFSGPEVSFITCMPRGENRLSVQVYSSLSDLYIDSEIVNIGSKEKYYLGLQLTDSLICTVKDSSFIYQ